MQTINFNTQCFKQAAHWGYDKYYNICNGVGDWTTVEWGAFDWTLTILGTLMFVGIITTAGILIVGGIRAERQVRERMLKYNDLPF